MQTQNQRKGIPGRRVRRQRVASWGLVAIPRIVPNRSGDRRWMYHVDDSEMAMVMNMHCAKEGFMLP